MTSERLSDFGLAQIALKLVTQRIRIDAPSLAEVSQNRGLVSLLTRTSGAILQFASA